jgi:hypothetical protein
MALGHVMSGRLVHFKSGWVVNTRRHAVGVPEAVMAELPATNRAPTKNHIHDFFIFFSCLIPELHTGSSTRLTCQTLQVI